MDEIMKEEPEHLSILSSITKNLMVNKERSRETIIYRIAMTLFHSGRYWENHILKILDEPVRVYLNLASNKSFQKNYDGIWELIEKRKNRMIKANFIKTLICFLIGGYLYYKNLEVEE